ncbi:MAG: DUF6436 domain-containing protein [Thalassotalea sp.]|nr:DUF6436 domain-containing protein [Thalassotalea sp.]
MWLLFTIVAFSYFISKNLVPFDAFEKLKGLKTHEVAKHFEKYILKENATSSPTILHFTNDSCRCNKFSQKHIDGINIIADVNQINVLSITINEDQLIPSIPSVAIIDQLGELIYFGPYGEGASCSKTSGFAKTILKNHIKGYSANLVVNDAKGCYCTV